MHAALCIGSAQQGCASVRFQFTPIITRSILTKEFPCNTYVLPSRRRCCSPPTPDVKADTIYRGGSIVTVNELQPNAEAVAVRSGRIVAVGYSDEVMKLRGPKTDVIDLAGKTMIPGLIDAHGHVFITGIQALSANLLPPPDGEGADVASIQRLLKAWVAKNEAVITRMGWIIGFSYDDSQLKEQRHPTREELDAVSTTVPVLIVHQSGHLAVMNSKGLALAKLTAASKNPDGGVIHRKPGSQEPSGVLEETAFFGALGTVLGKMGPKESVTVLKAGAELYMRYGYTTAQEGRGSVGSMATMTAAAQQGQLKLDVVAYPDIVDAKAAIKAPFLSRNYTKHFRIGGAKLNLDGSPQGKTAFLTKPYFKAPPGQKPDYLGYPTLSTEQVNDYVDQAFANGWQLLAHVSGDAAIEQFITAVRAAEKKHGMADRRPVAIHAHIPRPDQMDAFKALGIVPSFFPMHTFYWGDWHRDSVFGPERGSNIAPTGWALQRGMVFTSHHDSPVAFPDAMRVLDATVNRITRSGKVLGPEHRVSPLVALKAQTIWSAYQHFEEKTKGSIEVGKLADFAVLDQNPMTIDPLKLASIKVVETIKEGKSIYKREALEKRSAGTASCAESEACFTQASHALSNAGVIALHAHND
jgi:predicted amidohydrolase YtcJ